MHVVEIVLMSARNPVSPMVLRRLTTHSFFIDHGYP